MSEREPRIVKNQRIGIGLVLMMFLSSLTVMMTALPVAASSHGSLGLKTSQSPTPDSWHSANDPIELTVEIENYLSTASGSKRSLAWYACEGVVATSLCRSSPDASGTFIMQSIPGGTTLNLTASPSWTPGGNTETAYTIVYDMTPPDSTPADDTMVFSINVTPNFTDVSIDPNHDPLAHLQNLGEDNGQAILNSNTEYIFKTKGQSTVCGGCLFTGDFGWQLWTSDGTAMIDEAYTSVSNLPAWSGYDALIQNLPVFTYNSEGSFILKHGLFGSSGNPHGDLNPNNNIGEVAIVLNDDIDIKVETLVATHDAQASVFYYGNDRASTTISNLGYMSVFNLEVEFDIYSPQFELEVSDACTISVLHPGQDASCEFNVTTTGNNRLLRVRLPVTFLGGDDTRPADNTYQRTVNIEVGAINPVIQTNKQSGMFLTSDDIELVGRFSSIASQPLNFTWREGFYLWGYGQVLNLTGATYGLGHHNITLEVRDPFGETDYAYIEFDVLNSVELTTNAYQVTAITEGPASIEDTVLLPHLGSDYGIGEGNSPLMMLGFDVTDGNEDEIGLRSLSAELNLSAILPSTIDLSTVELRYLPSTDDTVWTYLDGDNTYSIDPLTYMASVSLVNDGVLLLVGELPNTNVSVRDVEWTQLQDGQLRLDWTIDGDITNPYVGGWNIYKLQGIQGTTTFPDPLAGVNEFIWDELTLTTLADTLELANTTWTDPEHLDTGICASYAIAPIDREGNPNFNRANITRVNGVTGLACGDALAPTVSITDFRHVWRFTNSTECFDRQNDWSICYEVDLTWTWPEHEAQGNLTWNLYRVEHAPDEVNLRFIDPVVEGMANVPGEQGSFSQAGIDPDGIRPYRTYYYILAPIDSVGNEQEFVSYPSPSVERVQIEDDWWTYNQHIIPPEPEPPEPPLGLPWLQKLNDATSVPEFQVAGLVLLATLVLNFILLPMLMKKRKRLSRVLEARKRNSSAAMDEFDEFF